MFFCSGCCRQYKERNATEILNLILNTGAESIELIFIIFLQALLEKIATLEKTINEKEEQVAYRDGQIDALREIEVEKDETINKSVLFYYNY